MQDGSCQAKGERMTDVESSAGTAAGTAPGTAPGTAHVVTFHKCGSNWFRRLFRDAADTHQASIRVASPNQSPINTSVERDPARTLARYRTADADAVLPHVRPGEPVVLCVRDPRDVLVSQYWSWKGTHKNNTPKILQMRERLNALSVPEGLHLLVEGGNIPFCQSARTWLEAVGDGRATLLKYEDVLADFAGSMGPALALAGLPLAAGPLADLQQRHAFSSITRREAGTEDRSHHYRKGVAGDHVNYFDTELTALFDATYGDVVAGLGYA